MKASSDLFCIGAVNLFKAEFAYFVRKISESYYLKCCNDVFITCLFIAYFVKGPPVFTLE